MFQRDFRGSVPQRPPARSGSERMEARVPRRVVPQTDCFPCPLGTRAGWRRFSRASALESCGRRPPPDAMRCDALRCDAATESTTATNHFITHLQWASTCINVHQQQQQQDAQVHRRPPCSLPKPWLAPMPHAPSSSALRASASADRVCHPRLASRAHRAHATHVLTLPSRTLAPCHAQTPHTFTFTFTMGEQADCRSHMCCAQLAFVFSCKIFVLQVEARKPLHHLISMQLSRNLGTRKRNF